MRRLTLVVLFVAGAAIAAESEGAAHETSILWKWANFALLAGVVGYGVSKSTGAFFRSRSEQIRGAIEEAARVRRDAESRASEIERRMANLGAEVETMRLRARDEMSAEGERLKQEAARALERIRRNAEQEIGAAARQARQDLKTYSARLALELARRKIDERLTAGTQAALVDSFARGLDRPHPGAR